MSGTNNSQAAAGSQNGGNEQGNANDPNQAAGQQGEGQGTNEGADDTSIFSDAKKAEAEIKKLRAENAKSRLKNKDLDGQMASMKATFDKLQAAFGGEKDETPPEEKVKQLQSQSEAMAVEGSITQLAWEQGIPFEQGDYFKFLLLKQFESLEEGEELSEEALSEVIAKVKGTQGGSGTNSTGLNSNAAPAPKAGAGDITVQKFVAMNLGEKSALYAKDQATYTRLFAEAQEKKLL